MLPTVFGIGSGRTTTEEIMKGGQWQLIDFAQILEIIISQLNFKIKYSLIYIKKWIKKRKKN